MKIRENAASARRGIELPLPSGRVCDILRGWLQRGGSGIARARWSALTAAARARSAAVVLPRCCSDGSNHGAHGRPVLLFHMSTAVAAVGAGPGEEDLPNLGPVLRVVVDELTGRRRPTRRAAFDLAQEPAGCGGQTKPLCHRSVARTPHRRVYRRGSGPGGRGGSRSRAPRRGASGSAAVLAARC